MRQGWEGGLAVAPLPETVARYVEACRAWGRSRYAGLAEADLLAELLERVVGAADAAGWPLFAAWRAQPLPDDGPGRVVQLLHVLREHRGGAHLGAVRTLGLSPLEAIVAGAGGPGNAAFFGWSGPLPEVTGDCGPGWPRRRRPPTPRSDRRTPCSTTVERDDLLRLLGAAAAAARSEA